MRLSLSDINKIGKAEIKINGLTVIAGTNDSGKFPNDHVTEEG